VDTKAQTPLLFNLLYNKLYNKSPTNRITVSLSLTHGSLHSTTRDQLSQPVYFVKTDDSIKKRLDRLRQTKQWHCDLCLWQSLSSAGEVDTKKASDDAWKSSQCTQQRRRQRRGGGWWQQRHFIAAAHRLGFPRSAAVQPATNGTKKAADVEGRRLGVE